MRPKLPWKVVIPKGAKSPTGSIYGNMDIVKQEFVLWGSKECQTLRSLGPFTVRVRLPNGKTRDIIATKEA